MAFLKKKNSSNLSFQKFSLILGPGVREAAIKTYTRRRITSKRGGSALAFKLTSCYPAFFFTSLAFETEQWPEAFSADGQCVRLNHLTAISLILRIGAKLNNK